MGSTYQLCRRNADDDPRHLTDARALDIDNRRREKLVASLAGGVFGAIYILLAIVLIPKLGPPPLLR
nr:hypothetical protein [Mesorhizobium sp.]